MRVRLDLGPDARERLIDAAMKERRPVIWQAEVLLRRALGLSDTPAEEQAAPAPTEDDDAA